MLLKYIKKLMRILISNNHMNQLGGSETWVFSIIDNLKKMNHNADLYIFNKINKKQNILYKKLKQRNIDIFEINIPKKKYDLIFANHTSTINKLLQFYNKKIIVQTCHGIYNKLEQPVPKLCKFVSVSQEIYNHLKNKNIDSIIIPNGIDCNRFKSVRKLNVKPKVVLSLVQSDKALLDIKQVCKELKLALIHFSKTHKSTFNIETIMNKVDIVVSVGRGVCEALSCGRNVISYDCRKYYTQNPMGHGLLKSVEMIDRSIKDNFTGRNEKKIMNKEQLKQEFLKYDIKYGKTGRNYILNNLNIQTNIKKYIDFANN